MLPFQSLKLQEVVQKNIRFDIYRLPLIVNNFSSYTANLAAFLTVDKMITPIENAEDLARWGLSYFISFLKFKI